MSIDGTLFLEQLTEKLKYRIEELDVVISEGQKDVESMHEYYWENYTEMGMRTMTTSRHCCGR